MCLGWEDIFETEDRATAEKLALECGTETISWSDDNTLNLTTVVFSGVEIEPRTGLETWFNAICLLHPAAHKSKTYVPWDVVYGDFSPINDDDVQTAIDVMAKAVSNFLKFNHFFGSPNNQGYQTKMGTR